MAKKTGENHSRRTDFKYYDLIMAAFVTVLLCANLIGVTKVTTFWGVTFGTGIFFFPLSYIFGDILTEVYGYARSRKVVWAGFASLTFASLMAWFVVHAPPAPHWPDQLYVEKIFGSTWRIVFASLFGFFAGEFVNSFILAKMKLMTKGKHLWMRTIGSTIVGEGVDSLLFYPLAFLGSWETELVVQVMLTNYVIKVAWEILMTPVTYKVVSFLKRVEHEDYYDWNTRFTPFTLDT